MPGLRQARTFAAAAPPHSVVERYRQHVANNARRLTQTAALRTLLPIWAMHHGCKEGLPSKTVLKLDDRGVLASEEDVRLSYPDSKKGPAICSVHEVLTAARVQFRQRPFLLGHDVDIRQRRARIDLLRRLSSQRRRASYANDAAVVVK